MPHSITDASQRFFEGACCLGLYPTCDLFITYFLFTWSISRVSGKNHATFFSDKKKPPALTLKHHVDHLAAFEHVCVSAHTNTLTKWVWKVRKKNIATKAGYVKDEKGGLYQRSEIKTLFRDRRKQKPQRGDFLQFDVSMRMLYVKVLLALQKQIPPVLLVYIPGE